MSKEETGRVSDQMGLNCASPNSNTEAQTPTVMLSGDGATGKSSGSHHGALPTGLVPL